MLNRTKTYAVYINEEHKNSYERIKLVAQGFNIWAFIFNFLWSAFNRLWVVTILLFIIAIISNIAESKAIEISVFVFNIWFAFEAEKFKAAKLKKQGYNLVSFSTALDESAALQRFLDASPEYNSLYTDLAAA